MKVMYKFTTGEVTEVEVSEEIGTVILDSRREEHASNERHRYHTAFSFDDMDYEDKDYFSAADNPEKAFMQKEFTKKRKAMLSQLTPVQRRRFVLFENGMSIAEIARKEKTAFNSVKESIESAQKKLKKLL
jgi:DNA-directed RNA polymerase specialized sigma24 family protein